MTDWPFCECGVTLLDGEDQCDACANAPHGSDCDCPECADYWHELAERSKVAVYRANRRLVCVCGWTGAFIEHHNSEVYGPTARAGCEIVYRCPADEREQFVRKAWTGSEWAQVGEAAGLIRKESARGLVSEPEKSRYLQEESPASHGI